MHLRMHLLSTYLLILLCFIEEFLFSGPRQGAKKAGAEDDLNEDCLAELRIVTYTFLTHSIKEALDFIHPDP